MIDNLIVTYLGHHWARKVAIVLSGVSLLLITYNIAYMLYYYQKFSMPDLTFMRHTEHSVQAKKEVELFGHYQVRYSSADTMPLSQLDLAVVSVMYSPRDPKAAFALIQKQQQPSHVYHLGDEILPGIHVERIVKEGVIVNNRHHLEMIRLPTDSHDLSLKPVRVENEQ